MNESVERACLQEGALLKKLYMDDGHYCTVIFGAYMNDPILKEREDTDVVGLVDFRSVSVKEKRERQANTDKSGYNTLFFLQNAGIQDLS